MRARLAAWLLALFAGLSMLCAASIATAAAAAGAAATFQQRCEERLGAPSLQVRAADAGYRIDTSLSYKTLTRMKGGGQAGRFVLGLTRAESRIGIALNARMLTDSASGRECMAPHVDVNLAYLPIVIYVSREFAPDSCAYRAILAHEMRHLNAYLDYLPKVEGVVRNSLTPRLGAQLVYAPAGQSRLKLQRELDREWLPFIKREVARVEHLQQAIDTEKEYARLSKVCAGEVQSLIGPVPPKD
ncbi:MAG: hypothetical protein ABIT83_00015 [Massilia sp.]